MCRQTHRGVHRKNKQKARWRATWASDTGDSMMTRKLASTASTEHDALNWVMIHQTYKQQQREQQGNMSALNVEDGNTLMICLELFFTRILMSTIQATCC